MPRDVDVDVCVCVGVVCVSHAKLSPFWLSLYPFAFLFSLCKINNSGLQRQRVEGENIHGKKNDRVMHPLSLHLSVYCLSRSTIAAFPLWWCVKPGGAASHTHTRTRANAQHKSAVLSCVQPIVEIELTAFAFCPKVLGTQTGSLVSPCLQQGW